MKYIYRLGLIGVLAAAGLLSLTGAGAGVRPAPAASAPAASAPAWTAGFADSGRNAPLAAATSPDGSMVYVAGYADAPDRYLPSIVPHTGVIIAYDAATGAKVWQQEFSSPQRDGTAFVSALVVSPDGSTVFVTGGYVPGKGQHQGDMTIAYDTATGTQLWQAFYGSSYGATAIAVSPDGSTVFVTGSGNTTLAYDAATGAQLWAASYPRSSAAAIALSRDGSTVYTAGGYDISRTQLDYGIVAFSAATGAVEWSHHSGQKTAVASATSIAVSGTAVYLTGKTSDGFGFRTLAYNATNGSLDWSISTKVAGTSVVAAPGGESVYTTGFTGTAQVTTAYDTGTGRTEWTRRYDPAGSSQNIPVSAALTTDGSTLFTGGYSSLGPVRDIYTSVAYNATTGAPQWYGRFARQKSAQATAMAITPDGSEVVLTGSYNFNYKTTAFRVP